MAVAACEDDAPTILANRKKWEGKRRFQAFINGLFGININAGSVRNTIGPGNEIAYNEQGIQIEADGGNADAATVLELRKDTNRVQSWFMDLNLVLGYWGETTRTYHHTAPINSLFALHEALLMLKEEGLENSWARHMRHHTAFKAGMEAMGLEFLVKEAYRLPQMNAIKIPELPAYEDEAAGAVLR